MRAQLRSWEPHACVCSASLEQAGPQAPGWRGGGGSGEEPPQQSLPPQPPSLPSLRVGRASEAVGSVLSPAVFPHQSLHM